LPVANINPTRLWRRLLELGEIGKDPAGGVTRLAFTPADREARELVMEWMRGAGLTVRVDAIGNIFARLEGTAPGRGVVLLASHLDTVPQGGRFDGALGVLAALEAVETLVERGLKPQQPVEVGVFVNEEGARFKGGLLGSSAVVHGVTPEELRQLVDDQGISCYQALADFGLDPEQVAAARRSPAEFAAYLELHIEQAAVLEAEGLPVGVVTGIAGPKFITVRLTGRADHAGATPMHLRRDALAGAAELILAAERIAREEAGPATVCTVGQIRVAPGATNVIPGSCEFSLDLRDIQLEDRERAETRLKVEFERVCRRRGLEGEWLPGEGFPPVRLDESMVTLLGTACREAGQREFRLVSGAAHDAMQFAGVCPVGMLFVRSVDGISHSPEEYTTPEDAAVGAEVLFHALCQLVAAR